MASFRGVAVGLGVALVSLLLAPSVSHAQSFGVELHNTLMPASGGMAGASLAKPQEVVSAIGGNPATLAQFRGSNFTFGGGWVESTFNMSHDGFLPNIDPFSAKSEAEGSALGNIAFGHEIDLMGRPMTMGMGLLSSAGAGLSFRDVPESNGTSVTMTVLQIGVVSAVQLTDCLSAGAGLILGSSTLDAPFQGAGAAAYAYALRGTVGLNCDVGCGTSLGLTYHSRQNFNFDDAIRIQADNGLIPDTAVDVDAGLPDNIGLGIANDCLLDGRLLLALDILYKHWDTADLFGDLYNNQWVIQCGAQYAIHPRMRLRLGYAYAENPVDTTLGSSAGGVNPAPPGSPPARIAAGLQYVQGTVAITNQHRLTGGIGITDILPGVNADFFAGGMFRSAQDLGVHTSVSVQSYWVGGGLTWEFGAGPCCE
jgi:long-chain fatty acid transport protein